MIASASALHASDESRPCAPLTRVVRPSRRRQQAAPSRRCRARPRCVSISRQRQPALAMPAFDQRRRVRPGVGIAEDGRGQRFAADAISMASGRPRPAIRMPAAPVAPQTTPDMPPGHDHEKNDEPGRNAATPRPAPSATSNVAHRAFKAGDADGETKRRAPQRLRRAERRDWETATRCRSGSEKAPVLRSNGPVIKRRNDKAGRKAQQRARAGALRRAQAAGTGRMKPIVSATSARPA